MGFMNIRHFRNAVKGLALAMGFLASPPLTGADSVRQTSVVKAVGKALPSVVNIRTETILSLIHI